MTIGGLSSRTRLKVILYLKIFLKEEESKLSKVLQEGRVEMILLFLFFFCLGWVRYARKICNCYYEK